jgi:hypothetical protein
MNYIIYDNSNFYSGIETYVKTISEFLNIPVKKFNNASYLSNVFLLKNKNDFDRIKKGELKLIFSNPISPVEKFYNQFVIIHDLYFLKGIYTINDPYYSIMANKIIGYEKMLFLRHHTLIPVSNYTKQQLKEKIKDAKITDPVYPILKEPPKLNQLPIFPKKINKIYILHISDFNIRKNIPFIQELFKHLDKNKYVLVRIGEKIPNIDNQINFKNISEMQKTNIIQHSDLCISPSIDEGFNSPVAECVLNEIPVISSSIPVIHEIYENSIITLSTDDISKWKDIIEKELWKYDPTPAKNILLRKIEQSKINLKNILNIK